MVLILIHQIHLLMYVPTIAAIVVLRYYVVQGFDRQNGAVGIPQQHASDFCLFPARSVGTRVVPEAEFASYLGSRVADPSRINLLSFSYIWYRPLSKEI